eukprot:3704278-Pyramimonas_sp.AAC.1
MYDRQWKHKLLLHDPPGVHPAPALIEANIIVEWPTVPVLTDVELGERDAAAAAADAAAAAAPAPGDPGHPDPGEP